MKSFLLFSLIFAESRVDIDPREATEFPEKFKTALKSDVWPLEESFTISSAVCVPTFPRPRETNRSRSYRYPSSTSSWPSGTNSGVAKEYGSMIDKVAGTVGATAESVKTARGLAERKYFPIITQNRFYFP